MNARADMLAAIRANRPGGMHGLPALPAAGACADPVAAFTRALAAMGGKAVPPGAGDALAPVRALLGGVICSLAPEVTGTMVPDAADMAAIGRIDVAVARAACGVAETGSVLFTEAELRVNAVAYLAQHLLVLLDPADIVADITAVYARREFRAARYAVLHTGPSATADIEGVLIHGAQGVRSLTVLLLPRGGRGGAAARN
jgi:L-lactate dehydrogenase complex protein LldG